MIFILYNHSPNQKLGFNITIEDEEDKYLGKTKSLYHTNLNKLL